MAPSDLAYLLCLAETTMRSYVEAVWGNWNEPEWRGFLGDALDRGTFQAILEGGKRVGAVSIQRHASHHFLDLICIEPQYQNKGVGEAAVRIILANALQASKPVRLRVLAPNPAKRLYERLGFVVTKETEERYYMEHNG